MNKKPQNALACSALAALISFSQSTTAQQAVPTENRGVAGKLLGAVDLGPEIEGMAGRQLRLRVITIEAGGAATPHSHKDRPCVEYIVQGQVIEHRNGVAKEYGPGDFVLATNDTTHWWENKGSHQAVLLPVDIAKTAN